MAIQLCNYQEIAVADMLEKSRILHNKPQKNAYILLHAITGSGKTVMAGAYIDRVLSKIPDTCIVWLSVGKGNLHTQSRDSLAEILPPGISVKMIDEALCQGQLYDKDVLVLNWESLNKKKANKSTGKKEFDNVAMRDRENRNLPSLLEDTQRAKTNIILMIDESHTTAGSETSKEIIELIKPIFTVELTATPDPSKVPQGSKAPKNGYYVPVNSEDVISEGIIKKRVILNDMTEVRGYEDRIDYLLGRSLKKHEELTEAYKKENVNVNPLVCIQIPDSTKGDDLQKEIISLLAARGITVSGGELAIWLSDQKDNLDDITSPTSRVSCLIFKQAIALGWNCPRASILVKLRDIKSETFDVQTIGRILRMIERKHYKTEVLNHGYIFTDAEGYKVGTGDYKAILPMQQVLKPQFKADVTAIKLKGTYLMDDKTPFPEDDIERDFKEQIKKYTIHLDVDSMASHFQQGDFDVADLDDVRGSLIAVDNIDDITISLTVKDVNQMYKNLCYGLHKNRYPYQVISNILQRHFMELAKTISSCHSTDPFVLNKMLIIRNAKSIQDSFTHVRRANEHRVRKLKEDRDFVFTEDRHSSEREKISLPKCAYEMHFVSRYKTENAFEEYLENRDDVVWWIKNEDNGFGILYEYANVEHVFYPDYFVRFKSDNRVGIYEVKSVNDDEKTTVTRDKIAALQTYANDNNLLCGLVECDGDTVLTSTLPAILR